MIGVEDPDVRSAHAGRGERRIDRAVLTSVRGGDEGAPPPRPGKDDVPRLVAHEQGAGDAAGVRLVAELDDAVREVIDDPDLGLASHREGDRLEADGDRGAMNEAAGVDPEDLEAVVRCVDGKQELPARRQPERADLPALEERERRRGARVGAPPQESDQHDREQHLGERSRFAKATRFCPVIRRKGERRHAHRGSQDEDRRHLDGRGARHAPVRLRARLGVLAGGRDRERRRPGEARRGGRSAPSSATSRSASR